VRANLARLGGGQALSRYGKVKLAKSSDVEPHLRLMKLELASSRLWQVVTKAERLAKEEAK